MLERWRRHLQRHHDAGSASMASYVVAAALFIVGSSYLVHFIIEPPGSGVANLQHAALKTQASNSLEVLLGSPGVPSNWDASSDAIDHALRVGLIESGTTIRVDPAKFDALARGKLETSSDENGAIDYAELKAKLGLDGYEFHLRAYPLISPSEAAPYGVSGYEAFEVAYVGDIDSGTDTWSEAARQEAHALDSLAIPFVNLTRASDPTGDVYMEDSGDIRDHLLPNIGTAIEQTIISSGSGTKYSFYRVNASTYAPVILTSLGLTGSAMALSQDGGEVIGYNKNRELRTILGSIDMSRDDVELTWDEWVDTDRDNGTYDCGDYGYVEVSVDDGANWIRFDEQEDRSQDCSLVQIPPLPTITPFGTAIKERSLDLDALCGATCDEEENVLLAFHWVSDNDNNIGYGWVVDNVLASDPAPAEGEPATLLYKTFEAPAYSMIIIGSQVDHQAFVPDDIKDAIRDYVDLYGGRILVVGGTDNENWLMRLFDVGIESGGGGISTPDVTHPLLTLPNELDYAHYTPNGAWDFEGSEDADLFHMVVQGADEDKHVLTVSQQGAWGESSTAEGAVILTSYLPWMLDQQEMRRFFANNVVYGRYHYLYLEIGPVVPDGEAIASVSRTATMNMYRDGDENYTEMAFIMYVWPGDTIDGTYGETAIDPTPPRQATATAASNNVALTWLPPASNGTGWGTVYHIYRGHSPSAITEHIDTVPFVPSAPSAGYNDTTALNGETYYYNITLGSDLAADAQGTPSDPVSASPVGQASAPTIETVAEGLTHVTVTWSEPVSTGGGTIFGYALYACDGPTYTDANDYYLVGEVGDTTTYAFPANDSTDYTFKVAALNAWGWSDASAASTVPTGTIAYAVAPNLTVTPSTIALLNTLTWAAPTDLGTGELEAYNVWRNATDSATEFELHAYLNSAANVSFIDENVIETTEYLYKVQAVTSVGDGLLSDAESGTTATLPGTPTGLAKTSGLLGTIIMGWDAPAAGSAPITQYEIYRGATSGTTSYLGISATTAYTDATAGAGTWWYKVRAVSTVGAGAFSTAVQMSA